MEKFAYGINEAASALSIGRTTVYKLIEQGHLETIKIGRRTLVKASSIEAVLNAGV